MKLIDNVPRLSGVARSYPRAGAPGSPAAITSPRITDGPSGPVSVDLARTGSASSRWSGKAFRRVEGVRYAPMADTGLYFFQILIEFIK
jgi:hypothetical protein